MLNTIVDAYKYLNSVEEEYDSDLDLDWNMSNEEARDGEILDEDLNTTGFLKSWSDLSKESLENTNKFSQLVDTNPTLMQELKAKNSVTTFMFYHKSFVTDFETMTKVEYSVQDWESLAHKLDLKWADKKNYKIISSLKELAEEIKKLLKKRILAVDTETTGVNFCRLSSSNPLKDKIVGMSLTWENDQGIYIPFRHLKFENLPLKEVMMVLKPILETKELILHNAIFDYKVFYDLGIKIRVVHDTMNMLFHIDSRVSRGGKALKYNISRIFGIDTLDLETMTGNARYAAKFALLDKKTCKIYGCADTDFAYKFFYFLQRFLSKRQLEGYRQDIKLIPIIARMEYYGRPIDMNKLPIFNEVNNKDIETLKDLCFKYVGTAINLARGIKKVERFIFNFNKEEEIIQVLYSILKIPILDYSKATGKPLANSLIFKTLLKEEVEEIDPVLDLLLKEDLISSISKNSDYVDKDGKVKDYGDDDDRFLVQYKKISVLKYPFIYLMKRLRKRIKLKTSFFAKLMDDNFEGKYFTTASLTGSETHRIIDVIQTIPAFMKEIFIAFDNQYPLDADFEQVEARVFTNEAGMQNMIEQLKKPYADFHRENGSMLFGKKPKDISKEERGSLKAVNFGLVFDMKEQGLVNYQWGIITDKELKKIRLAEMKVLSEKWKTWNRPIYSMLEKYRDEALTINKEPRILEYFKGSKMSVLYSKAGRTRVFCLDGIVDDNNNIIDPIKASKIRRQAGNFPVQDYARHLFGEAVLNLFNNFDRLGWLDIKVQDDYSVLGYHFECKVYLMALVHDEFFLSIDNDINEAYIIKTIKEECMLEYENEAPYYMGISFCHNWHEGHSGNTEISNAFVNYYLETHEDFNPYRESRENPVDTIMDQFKRFKKKQILHELFILSGQDVNYKVDLKDENLSNLKFSGTFNCNTVLDKFENYTIIGDILKFKGLNSEEIEEQKQVVKQFYSKDEENVELLAKAIVILNTTLNTKIKVAW